MKLMFGEFKGKDIHNVPRDYLEGLLMWPGLWEGQRRAIEAQLAEWDRAKKPKGQNKPME